MGHRSAQIRNLALVGPTGAGKTSLFEALLVRAGRIAQAGSVERGTTVADFDPIEKQRGHSLGLALSHIEHGGLHLNLIDTPGLADFRGPALCALAAVETACIVVSATQGVDYSARRMMDYARSRNLARVLVVNKIDADGVDPGRLLDELRAAFGVECLPLNLPAGRGQRVLDCLAGREGDSDLGAVADWHQRLVDQVVEINETVMGHYLDAGEDGLSGEELHAAFEQCLREGHLLPVCFTSARTGAGTAEFLELVERWFPHPAEANPPPFVRGRGEPASPVPCLPDPTAHVIADVFQIVHDPFAGKLAVLRVFQGTLRRETTMFVDDARKPVRIGPLFRLHGAERREVAEAVPGDIVAVAKIDELHFDAVLHDSHDEDGIHLAPLPFPKPMFGLAIEAVTRGQEQKLAVALAKLADEDPCFQIEQAGDTHETVIRGLSELHLKIQLQRLKERFQVEVVTRPPKVPFRETISRSAEGRHRHKKQTGGAGQFGEVHLRVEALPRGQGFAFVDAVKGGSIPGAFLPAVEKGVRQALAQGVVAGFPLQDLRVVVLDGKHHPVDSKEVAFVTAGRKAFLEAIGKAGPQLLEPVVELTVTVPAEAMGDLTGALAAKRARIHGSDSARAGEVVVRAHLPMAELEGFPGELKSLSAGRGRYDLEFSHYDTAPPALQARLAAARKPRAEED
ncbi:elongation factor G [Silanimonas sp.]|uniref:elongation factor G n=1 Tax=Silanimonas sp. TaxID=1929290 RepID=UPI001BC2CB0B|nr:elongation factor G [Silanimonas sp.]MBS3896416.1 elongation factor G [Silanimonas sp.]MBS3924500.1 elongation factor G [Xanthomonadaceae bacterium]